MVPSFAVVGTLVALAATGALAVSFSVSGIPFKLSADKLTGTNFVQLGSMNAVNACDASNAYNGTTGSCFANHQFTAATLLDTATITNLDQTVCSSIPVFTGLTGLFGIVELKGGDGVAGHSDDNTYQPHATNLIVDATSLSGGTAIFSHGINIGEDYNVTGAAPFGEVPTHTFSQQAPTVEIDTLHQTGTDTYAGTFTIPNLNLTANLISACP